MIDMTRPQADAAEAMEIPAKKLVWESPRLVSFAAESAESGPTHGLDGPHFGS